MALRPWLSYISLCTGGGGLDMGLELAMPGARPVVLVEREAFAVAHLVEAMEAGLMAPAPVWSDARTLDGRRFRGIVDGVIGGIPCQPHSLAGKRLGRDDERDLWGAARRIIVQSGAWWCLIENVPGMLSSGGAERVWRDLHRLGFAVEGGLFSAAEVGATHERERLFILAVADAGNRRAHGEPRDLFGEAHGDRAGASYGSGRNVGHGGEALADCHREGLEGHGRAGERAGEWPAGSRRGEMVHALGSGHDRDAGGEIRGSQRRVADARTGGPVIAMADAQGDDRRLHKGRGADRRRAADLRRAGEIPVFPPGPGDLDGWRSVLARAPELEPAICRMAHGLAPRVDRLRMCGNGVVPLAAAHAVRTLATRLAERSPLGAALAIRMTEAAE